MTLIKFMIQIIWRNICENYYYNF